VHATQQTSRHAIQPKQVLPEGSVQRCIATLDAHSAVAVANKTGHQ